MSKLIKSNNNIVVADYKLPLAAQMELDNGGSVDVDIKILDKRVITTQQRKFIFALMNEYEFYTGTNAEWFRMLMQNYNGILRDIEVESLSTCSVEYANGLIDTVISYFIDNEIPLGKTIDEYKYNFNAKQTYTMVLKRSCVICGDRADIHHIDAIGMGNNRDKVTHIGKRILPLCRTHHNEIHAMGNDKFINHYHLETITIDKKLEHFIKRGNLKYYKEETE